MTSQRLTQAEANYRPGDPIDHCGVCRYYQGHHHCSQVMGDITPYGVSDAYLREQNQFPSTLDANELKAIKAMAADAQDRSNLAPQAQQGPPQGQQAA